MKFSILLLFMVALLNANVSIVTGGKGGTYYSFGKQISEVCGNTVGGLDVVSTGGSMDNIHELLTNPKVKFAIVQYDVLLYLLDNGTREERNEVKKLSIIMPLYNEEIHLITRKELKIQSIYDLDGLRVSIGAKNSGTFITSRNIAKYGGVRWGKTFAKGIKRSLKDMKNGDLDAVFYVAGVPAKIFRVTEDMGSIFYKYKKYFSIVDMSNAYKLDKIYSTSKITKKDYPWIDRNIYTKAVRSVLISYNYKYYQPSYKRVRNLYKCLSENIDKLQTSKFHPKWKKVNPNNFNGINWKINQAVKEYINNKNDNYYEQKSHRKVQKDDEIKNFFDSL